jgi:PAS domain S-box-containing protein
MPSFRALVEKSPDVIFLMNAAGEMFYTSPSTAKVFGYRPEELVGRNTFELIHPQDRDLSQQAFREVLATPPGPRHLQARFLQKNGEWCWVESTLSNFLDEPRVAAIVANFRDIGARRAAEHDQWLANTLLRSQTEIEDFAYAVAHDLREPLRTISMFADRLLKQSKLDLQGEESTKSILGGVIRISALLDGLLAFGTRDFNDAARPVELGVVVAEVLQNLGHAIATSNATVTVDPLPVVSGTPEQLLRVIQNLIVNSIKYRSAAPVEIHVTAERQGPVWVVKVKDNGMGIAPEYHERVFSLLKRLHGTEIPGGGMGLAICKKIVEASGGTIWVESALGAGSTFCFTAAAARQRSFAHASGGYPASDNTRQAPCA